MRRNRGDGIGVVEQLSMRWKRESGLEGEEQVIRQKRRNRRKRKSRKQEEQKVFEVSFDKELKRLQVRQRSDLQVEV